MTDRTLDQQCTVTRPGIAAIASALLVEILVSILQHPAGPLAPAPNSQSEDRGDHPLGIVPHQIRGFLSSFHNMLISGKSYDCCSACSDKVTQEYKKDAWGFVKRALNERGYVEELSGLAEVSGSTGSNTPRLRVLIKIRCSEQRKRRQLMSRGTTRMKWERMTGRERLSETWHQGPAQSAPMIPLCTADWRAKAHEVGMSGKSRHEWPSVRCNDTDSMFHS